MSLPRPSLLALAASLGLAAFAPPGAARADEPKSGTMRVYLGTYTGGSSKGIYVMDLDLASGKVTEPRLAAEAVNPSFLALDPKQRFLYAVSEVASAGGKKSGAVAAFAIDPRTGKLTELNRQPSGGAGPCHVVVDKTGQAVLVANYGGGSVASLPVGKDGRLQPPASVIQHEGSSVNKARQEAPHAHSINLDAANRIAAAADLGLDKVLLYRFDPDKGTLTPNEPPSVSVEPGSGPRHFAFHPNGRNAYVINEMTCTVTAFAYDPERGALQELQTITTLPDGKVQKGYSTAEVQVHPSGKFVYGSNRGHNSIAIFAVDESTGRLRRVGHESTQGKTPRNFGIDPTGRYLLAANQDSDTVVVFRIDGDSGKLQATGAVAKVPRPVCVKFMPVGE